MTYKAHIFGFDADMSGMIGDALFFAGAEPVRFQDVASFTKTFRQEPPSIIAAPLAILHQLDLHVMLGGDERFDQVAVLAAVEDPYDPRLRESMERCALDYFLVSQPYHLKRLALAVMSRSPWGENPATSGRLLLAEANLERRIGIARAMRIARFDVSFADTAEDLEERLRSGEPTTIVIANLATAGRKVFEECFRDGAIRKVPWIAYSDREILANSAEGKLDRLEPVGTDPNPDTLLFHAQEILKKPQKDLRKCKRLPMSTPVSFRVDTLRETVWAYTRDFGLKGIFIRTAAPPPPETMVTVSFRAPTAEGMTQVGARVAWRKDYGESRDPMKPAGMGVHFTRVSAPDSAAIEAGYKALGKQIEASPGG